MCSQGDRDMDPKTGCGLPSAGQKARLLIGAACWFLNYIGRISSTATSMGITGIKTENKNPIP